MPDVTGGALPKVAHGIAYRAVRNRGTIGGSLTHADPSADWISILAALGRVGDAARPAMAYAQSLLRTTCSARLRPISDRANCSFQ